jgi:hypothetical protein
MTVHKAHDWITERLDRTKRVRTDRCISPGLCGARRRRRRVAVVVCDDCRGAAAFYGAQCATCHDQGHVDAPKDTSRYCCCRRFEFAARCLNCQQASGRHVCTNAANDGEFESMLDDVAQSPRRPRTISPEGRRKAAALES